MRFIQISLDGSNKETYESVRIGSDFDRVIKSIRALIRAGFTVSVNTVLMRKNQYDILAIVKLCESLGVNYYKVSPLMETGRASEEQPSKQLSLAEYREIYQNVLEYKNARKPGGMQVIFYQNTVRPEVKNISWMPEEHFGCPA